MSREGGRRRSARRPEDSQLAELAHLGLCLVLEECVVKFLVVDVDLAHFWLNAFAGLLLERLRIFLLFDCVALRRDAGIGNEAWTRSVQTFVSEGRQEARPNLREED